MVKFSHSKERQRMYGEWIADRQVDISISESARASYAQVSQKIELEKEGFLSNLPYTASAKSLVSFIQQVMKDEGGYMGVPAVRVEMLVKCGRRNGCAVVIFRDACTYNLFKSLENKLLFMGRTLRVKEGNGKSKRKRRIHDETYSFSTSRYQIGLPILDQNSSFHMKDEFEAQDVHIDGSKGRFYILFTLRDVNYRAEYSIRQMRHLTLEEDETASGVVMSFYSLKNPRLSCEDFNFDICVTNAVNENIWENCINNSQDLDWLPTVDPTPFESFKFCLTTRVFIRLDSKSGWDCELMRLITALRNFRLLPKRFLANGCMRIKLNPCRDLYENWKSLQIRDLDVFLQLRKLLAFPIIYCLHCLVGARKVDLAYEKQLGIDTLVDTLKAYSEGTTLSLLYGLFSNFTQPFVFGLRDFVRKFAPTVLPHKPVLSGRGFLVRRVLVTPLRVCPQPPEEEPSNRVLRQFYQYREHFLRLKFVDESFQSVLNCAYSPFILGRIRKVVKEGLYIGGYHYRFLAFSNSSIRDQSCWFYDENPRDGYIRSPPSADEIRNSVGCLKSIKLVGKFAARLGQGFSSTTPAATCAETDFCVVDDIERNGFCFSDGVGMISATYANEIATHKLTLPVTPSAFQVRFGGVKGLLTVTPDECMEGHKIVFRKSMVKFESHHMELEINDWSKATSAYLNRQLISILSSLGVPDEIFLTLLNNMIATLDRIVDCPLTAAKFLRQHSDIGIRLKQYFAPAAAVYEMISAGMSLGKEPYVAGFLQSLRNRLVRDLKYKARILVPDGYYLFGVMDETHTLEEGEIFVQFSNSDGGEPTVLSCPQVLVGRNPSLHPGDLRILKPRDVPALRHLVDVLVFPSKGTRPHCNEMSGGDLDGDVYFVISDSNLFPRFNYAPMDFCNKTKPEENPPKDDTINDIIAKMMEFYNKTKPEENPPTDVTIDDIANFFVDYIKNDRLGMIANAHLVYADLSDEGVRCKECLKLAELHSIAVDFIKTGISADLPLDLRTTICPHFMENPSKSTYHSNKILGKIYDLVSVRPDAAYWSDRSFEMDKTLLYNNYEHFIEDTLPIMEKYNDELWSVMQYFQIYNEMELISGHVSNDDIVSRDLEETQARINRKIISLKQKYQSLFWDEFRETLCHNKDDVKDFICWRSFRDRITTSLVNDVADGVSFNILDIEMRILEKASAWYYCAYSEIDTFEQTRVDDTFPPLVSFPWVVYDILCHIKRIGQVSNRAAGTL